MSRAPHPPDDSAGAAKQRLDKYLWFARMARTRAAAASLVTGRHVRLNGRKIDQPSRAVVIGDVLTVSLSRDVRVLRVLAFAERRGPYEDARQLYEDLSERPAGPDDDQE
ncbi:MAG: S4 domain-containing protein [Beijerinckiaceae bacterium]|nr:S4 domain-containing protein [Beijerinckiaceae bacterium]